MAAEEAFEGGKELLGEKSYKQAIKSFTKAIEMNGGHVNALFYRGVTYLDAENPEKAALDFQNLINIQPDYKRTVYIVLSIAYRRL